ALADVFFSLIGVLVALLGFKSHFVGTAVLGTAQGADGTGNRGVEVRTCTGDNAAGKGGGVELMLGVQVQRDVHGFFPLGRWLLAMQQVQEVRADTVVVGLYVDHLAVVAVVVPVQQGRTQASHQTVGDVACVGQVVVVFFRQHAAQNRHGSTHHVHGVAVGRQGFQRGLQGQRQATQTLELLFVRAQFVAVGQFAVDQQM